MTDLVNTINGPSTSELVELLERQDCIMDSLQEEIDVCKQQIDGFRRAEQERVETDKISTNLVSEAEKKVHTALAAVEALQAHNKNLEAEITMLRQKASEAGPVATIGQLKAKIKEVELELEREQVAHENDLMTLEEIKNRGEVYALNAESALKAKDTSIALMTSKVEAMSKELVETKFKLDELQADRDHATARMTGEMEVLATKEHQLNQLVAQLSKEITNLRGERASMGSRIAALTQENASLRVKAVKKDLSDPLLANGTEEQMQKLLSDQSHLISALREESKLLTERLELERQEYKRSVKRMKAENKELLERIRKLTSE